MKNIYLALNAVLLIAVAVLFYLVLSGNKDGNETATTDPNAKNPEVIKAIQDQKMPDGKFAFVNLDTISMKYEYINDKAKALKNKAELINNQYQTMGLNLEKEVAEAENAIQAGLMSKEEVEKKSYEIETKRQALMAKQNELTNLQDDQTKLIMDAADKINAFVKKYNEQYHYEFIFNKSAMLNTISFADPGKDITSAILNGLNEEYKAQKASAKK